MSFLGKNNQTWGNRRIYQCKICLRTFDTSQGFAGHHKAHRPHEYFPDEARDHIIRAPYQLQLPNVPQVITAPALMTNGASAGFVYAPPLVSAYNPLGPLKNNYVAEAHSHNKKNITNYKVLPGNKSEGSSERTFSDAEMVNVLKDGIEVTSKRRKVETELDLELRL